MNGDIFRLSEQGLLLTVICVGFFWVVITILAIATRQILFFLFEPDRTTRSSTNPLDSNTAVESTGHSWLLSMKGAVSRYEFSRPLLLTFLDAIATFEVCACSMECWPIRAVAGRHGHLLAIALNGVRSFMFTCKDAYGSPCNPWYRFLVGSSTFTWVSITWIFQLLGAHAALRFARSWWALRPTAYHAARHELAEILSNPDKHPSYSSISSDLNVPFWQGFFIEGSGSFIEFYLAFGFAFILNHWNRYCSRSRSSSATNCTDCSPGDSTESDRPAASFGVLVLTRFQLYASFAIRLLLTVYLTEKCIGLTGFYLNPANAYIQSFGIGETSALHHIVVYWCGPFFGVWLDVHCESWTIRLTDNFTPNNRSFAVPSTSSMSVTNQQVNKAARKKRSVSAMSTSSPIQPITTETS